MHIITQAVKHLSLCGMITEKWLCWQHFDSFV